MRLLGILQKADKELFLIQDKNRFSLREGSPEDFKNYELIKNRDSFIGNKPKTGHGVFNFRYGPVKAGVVEAGVFNIYTYGERILSVNIDPSYKSRNIEKLMIGKTPPETLRLSEIVCGNFAFSHSLAFSRAIENISSFKPNNTTIDLRKIALELERIYNHIHVIARLSSGAAQNVLTSHLYWIFEECLRINDAFCESRFLKGCNKIGSVSCNIERLAEVKEGVNKIKGKFEELYEHSLKSYNFIDRLYKVAPLTKEKALDIGITGPSLRATGVECDLRMFDESYNNFTPITASDGDALARMEVRAGEILQSCEIITNAIDGFKAQDEQGGDIEFKDGASVGYAESPSGIVAYYVELKDGRVVDAYISTPSVFGFKAFADSFEGFIFTDFSFAYDSFGINFADCAR